MPLLNRRSLTTNCRLNRGDVYFFHRHRRTTDEIVQVESGTYLGKVHLHILPGYPFTMGYFRLEE